MESDLTVSYEKLVLDNEILGMCQRVLRGIEVNDDTLAVDLMIEKGPGKDYVAEEHTVRHMRSEFFDPKLANRDKRGAMQPRDDAVARARQIVDEIRTSQPESCLPAAVRDRILQEFPAIARSAS
jgi:trimethylamine--corrinoid protein Co-methyltransferase